MIAGFRIIVRLLYVLNALQKNLNQISITRIINDDQKRGAVMKEQGYLDKLFIEKYIPSPEVKDLLTASGRAFSEWKRHR